MGMPGGGCPPHMQEPTGGRGGLCRRLRWRLPPSTPADTGHAGGPPSTNAGHAWGLAMRAAMRVTRARGMAGYAGAVARAVRTFWASGVAG
eukprot:s638_g16.t1